MLADEEVCVWTAPAAILGDLDRVCRNPCQGWFPSSFDLPFRRAQHSCRIAARFSVVAHSRSPGHRRVFPSRFHYPAPALIQVGARVGRLPPCHRPRAPTPPPPTPAGARFRRTSRGTTTGTRAGGRHPELAQQLPEGAIRERSSARRPEHQALPTDPDLAKNGQRSCRQRDPVIASFRVLHPVGRDHPGPPRNRPPPTGPAALRPSAHRQHHQLERQPHRSPWGSAR